MSELADRQRRARRAWAAAGGGHDGIVAAARVVLPVAAGLLAALLAVAPLTVGREISFILAKDRVEVASERMRVSRADYRGADGKGQPFSIDAASAVQANSRDPIVRLQQLAGHIVLTDGPAVVRAPRGRYDMDTQHLAFDGPVTFDGSGGYHIATQNVLLDMTSKVMASRGPVTGRMPLGTFAADKLRANLDERVVDLEGRARLHIVQARSRGAR